jgi:hypothetical protein
MRLTPSSQTATAIADRSELFRELHLLGERHEPLAVGDLDTMPLERPAAGRIEPIHRQSPVGAPMTRHEIGDLSCPSRGLLGNARTSHEIVEGDGGPYLGDITPRTLKATSASSV